MGLFEEKGKKWIPCAHQTKKKASLKQRLSLINAMGTLNGKKVVYRISLWPYKHDRCRTFCTPSRSRYTRNNWKNFQYGVGRSEIESAAHGSVVSILKDHFCMKKLSARWMPRLLTIDHKRNRMTSSIECLALFNRNKEEFLRRFVTMDETRIHEEGQSGFVSQ